MKQEEIIKEFSFFNLSEKDRTKHIHRLHPYKGKYFPQLVEYFLDDKPNKIKPIPYFKKGDIILDPFCGSGTTLIEANELGIHSIGVDISPFGSFITNTKLSKVNLLELEKINNGINKKLKEYENNKNKNVLNFEKELKKELKKFNQKNFSSIVVTKLKSNGTDFDLYCKEKEHEFLNIYNNLLKKYNIKINNLDNNSFLNKWYLKPVKDEIEMIFKEINKISDQNIKNIMYLILSRTIRSCRTTNHFNLGNLKKPQKTTYYCKKHKKICKPVFSIFSFFKRYSQDTINRMEEFDKIRTNVFNECLNGDSREINIYEEIKNQKFLELIKQKKIKGIFSSPPYLGLINYHEQHEYAYELFKFKRNDDLEIGPIFKGTSKKAKEDYINGIVKVLLNSKKYLSDDFDIFLVANDKYDLYPIIAEKANLKIINEYKRPVTKKTDYSKSLYIESIFHMKENN